MPHFSFTITGLPVRPFKNGLGFTGNVAYNIKKQSINIPNCPNYDTTYQIIYKIQFFFNLSLNFISMKLKLSQLIQLRNVSYKCYITLLSLQKHCLPH